MSCDVHQFYEDYKQSYEKMKELMPDVVSGFSSLFSKVMKDGCISLREKELIAVGIAVAIKCEPCIRLHVKKSLETGATAEQILEAATVAVMMGGGPAFTHLPIVIETLQGLQKC
jgi:AhpD family alkylhydroperoxidase